jgi:hypothetical protein
MNKLAFVFAVLVAAAALAGDGTVSLSPAVITLRGEAGQSTRQTLFLRNSTSRALTFEAEAADVVVRDGKRVFARAGSTTGSIAATAVFSQKKLTVAPGQTAAIDVTVTIPHGSTERAVVALFHGLDKIPHGNVTATASLGALLTFTLSDGVTMTASPLVVQPQTPTSNLGVTQTCTNAGGEPLVTRGMLAVIGGDGKLVGKSALPPRRLLPGERATLGAEYGAELRPGRYRVVMTYDYEGRALSQAAEVEVR